MSKAVESLKAAFGDMYEGGKPLARPYARAVVLEVETEIKILRDALEFYATYSPRHHPDGYYEINIQRGEGGEVKFGTIAKRALAKGVESDPTPWCSHCGAKTYKQCGCGPIAENE